MLMRSNQSSHWPIRRSRCWNLLSAGWRHCGTKVKFPDLLLVNDRKKSSRAGEPYVSNGRIRTQITTIYFVSPPPLRRSRLPPLDDCRQYHFREEGLLVTKTCPEVEMRFCEVTLRANRPFSRRRNEIVSRGGGREWGRGWVCLQKTFQNSTLEQLRNQERTTLLTSKACCWKGFTATVQYIYWNKYVDSAPLSSHEKSFFFSSSFRCKITGGTSSSHSRKRSRLLQMHWD